MDKYWDSEDIFFNGDQYFDQMFKDIDEARELITIEVYIFNDDFIGKEMASRLIQAHKRGVKINLMVDGIGSYDFFDKLYARFSAVGIPVKIYNPLPFIHPYYGKLNLRKKLQTFLTRMWRLNSRNHRKIFTIDRHIMFTGSFNVSAEHTSHHHEKSWKDMGVRVTGENVRLALFYFKKIWNFREFLRYRKVVSHLLGKKNKNSPLRLNHSLFMRRFYYRDLLYKINHSESRIWLMTPYFIPKSRLIRNLAKAAQKGCDVRIIISARSDVKFFQSLQYFYFPYLMQKGVKIFLYDQTILHSKNFIIDDWITVGSSNLNHRSFLHDLEVDLSIQNQSNKEKIETNFIESATVENELTIEHLKQRTVFDKLLSRLFFLFKYWF